VILNQRWRDNMGDPDLRNDEKVLVRTPGVYVKSIPFEGLLTNKRIILIDRAKNLLPSREIPLVTIRDIDAGENAIRDQILTLTVSGKTGETRKMILTFSRQAGGNRVKERDEWYRTIRQYTSSVVEQPVRNFFPEYEQYEEVPQPAPPRTRDAGYQVTPASSPPVPPSRAPVRRGMPDNLPVKKIDGMRPIPGTSKGTEQQGQVFGTFCTRCGNRLSEGSVFCNRCGSPVIVPGQPVPQPTTPSPVRPVAVPPVTAPQRTRPADTRFDEARGVQPAVPVSPDAVNDEFLEPEGRMEYVYEEPRVPVERSVSEENYRYQEAPAAAPVRSAPRAVPPPPPQKPGKKRFLTRLFSSKEPAPTPVSTKMGGGGQPPSPKKPGRGSGFRAGRKVIIGIVAIVIILLVAVVGMTVLYPMLSSGGGIIPGGNNSGAASPTATPTSSSGGPVTPTQTFVVQTVTPAPTVPPEGVYLHVNYIAGWKASYGMPNSLQTATNSRDRYLEIENATGTVQATVQKLDASTTHVLLVEIYKNGSLLTTGSTSDANGKVTVSAAT
jgi:hypothetical protein